MGNHFRKYSAMKKFRFSLLLLAFLIVSFSLPGCGGRKDLNEISGTVTLGDDLLQCGTITFSPMETGGTENAAPPTSIGIVDGKYKITKQWGLKPGKYRVTIQGFEGTPRGDQLLGLAICPAFNTIFDYTDQKTQDFQLPALTRPMRTASDRSIEAISSKQE